MVIIGSDHAGIELREEIKKYLNEINVEFLDVCGKNQSLDDDYPDVAKDICDKVLESNDNIGIAICGTGIGISIACNKVKNIRAANCLNIKMAELARKHNDANILCLGARLDEINDFENVKSIINTFLNTSFEGGRHLERINKISKLEN